MPINCYLVSKEQSSYDGALLVVMLPILNTCLFCKSMKGPLAKVYLSESSFKYNVEMITKTTWKTIVPDNWL